MPTIALMSAVPEELNSVRSALKNPRVLHREGKTDYVQGEFAGVPIIMVFSGWGKIDAAITSTTLIERFKVDAVVFTGVAGAANDQVAIGDIVIGASLYQHDFDASPLFDPHIIPSTQSKFAESDAALVQLAEQAATAVLSHCAEIIGSEHLKPFNITKPCAHTGIIATGDQFIYQTTQTERIAAATSKVLAVEMEGAAIAHVCNRKQVPCVVVRTISDRADHKAAVDFPAFIEHVATRYALALMERLMPLIAAQLPARTSVAQQVIAQQLATTLQLMPHPEGGYFKETDRDPVTADFGGYFEGGIRHLSTSIYFLLGPKERSALHVIKSNETWSYHAGCAMRITLVDPIAKTVKHVVVGNPLDGYEPQTTVPKGVWFGSAPVDDNGFSLCGCHVAPGFDFRDFRLISKAELLELIPTPGQEVLSLIHSQLQR